MAVPLWNRRDPRDTSRHQHTRGTRSGGLCDLTRWTTPGLRGVSKRADTQLFLRSLDGDSTQPLSGTEAANLPFWSPDGQSVGFFALQQLKRIDIDDGLVQTVA